MKKVINVKEIVIILISLLVITIFSTNVLAIDLFQDGNNTPTISGNEYDNAQQVPEDKNNITKNNITTNNTTNNTASNNSIKKYNTNNSTDLPQTGIEDYNVGILLVICIASAMFAYKKITDYKNI